MIVLVCIHVIRKTKPNGSSKSHSKVGWRVRCTHSLSSPPKSGAPVSMKTPDMCNSVSKQAAGVEISIWCTKHEEKQEKVTNWCIKNTQKVRQSKSHTEQARQKHIPNLNCQPSTPSQPVQLPSVQLHYLQVPIPSLLPSSSVSKFSYQRSYPHKYIKLLCPTSIAHPTPSLVFPSSSPPQLSLSTLLTGAVTGHL